MHPTRRADLFCESISLKIEEKENKLYNEQKQSNFAEKWSILTSLSFWKPFCLLNVVFTIGLEWTGLPAIAFYMVPLLEQSQVPLSPYWAAAMLASYRALMSVLGSTFNGKCQRRPLYLSCCAINIIGLTMLSAYCYFNQNGLLTSNFPIATWIPIISIMILYSGYGLGFGGMPYQLQGELLPSNARSFGSGLLGIIDNISLFVSCKMAPTWNEILGIHGAFLMYACNCALVALICFFCMPETSTMTLEEIETMYKTEKKASK